MLGMSVKQVPVIVNIIAAINIEAIPSLYLNIINNNNNNKSAACSIIIGVQSSRDLASVTVVSCDFHHNPSDDKSIPRALVPCRWGRRSPSGRDHTHRDRNVWSLDKVKKNCGIDLQLFCSLEVDLNQTSKLNKRSHSDL